MDPSTVIVLLALNLIGIGGLLLLISRRTPETAGLTEFGAGALVFGLAYLVRLWMGLSSGSISGVVPDTAMVVATVCFASGLLQFSGRRPLPRSWLMLGALVYLLSALAATAVWQGVGRHATLNLSLGLGYGSMSAFAWAGARRELAVVRMPLRLFSVLTGLLALATAARGVLALTLGLDPLFAGLAAQAYYALSIVVTMLVGPNLLWMVFVRLNNRLTELATHDPLTRALNRNGLDAALRSHFGARPPQTLVWMLVDLDHFKQVNDTHGHSVGDAVLHAVTQTLAAQLRGADFLARWGGEEFLVGCAGADGPQARVLAERLRQAVESMACLATDGQTLTCSVSVGVSMPFKAPSGWETALREADEALYEAKRRGRNRVVVAAAVGNAA